ncbi:hypothetical protein D1815_18615 [Aquimarina sp. AD1]|uniref:right-handed parallel beta-helix repeat-containing protein n=2 Tax=Aquimarina sp. (strain AD1) TaxID=1714848 RepID=UPI000E48A71E|nr:right-handed parallel beta-helix repeat-containing protein [Aquimarina sp. AD1]AXT57664.1 hypothetical protein D1815_18615 [Aquimarina sp. AD1]
MRINDKNNSSTVFLFLLLLQVIGASSQEEYSLSELVANKGPYIPNYSYAGYQFGEKEIKISDDITTVLNATDFGVVANDEKDDSKALLRVFEKAHQIKEPVLIQLPAGRIILSEVLYFERSNIVLNGQGVENNGTEIFCPRPMMYLKDPNDLKELREYLVKLDKIQKEEEKNIFLPFSQYSWSGGMFWTRTPGARVKSYLKKYDKEPKVLGTIENAKRGSVSFKVHNDLGLNKGDVVEIQWFNKKGKEANILRELYGDTENLKIGSHHWNYTNLPLIRQQAQIEEIVRNQVTIKSPLLTDIIPEYEVRIIKWDHLKEVGIQNFKITFPFSNRIAHHVEQGYNGIYLTRVFNSWVQNVVIENSDSGILTEAIANVTIKDIKTTGKKKGHYTVQMGGVHNVLVKNLSVHNDVMHPLSFNTFSTKSVYHNCEVFKNPILDQHSGVNHQNLFDLITVHLNTLGNDSYPLFTGGGAGYWKPSHASYSTFWNIKVNFLNTLEHEELIRLDGMNDGPNARLVGISGNQKIVINYNPDAYVGFVNEDIKLIPSLYKYQLKRRLKN